MAERSVSSLGSSRETDRFWLGPGPGMLAPSTVLLHQPQPAPFTCWPRRALAAVRPWTQPPGTHACLHRPCTLHSESSELPPRHRVPARTRPGTLSPVRPLWVKRTPPGCEENPSTRRGRGCRGRAQSNQATDDNSQRPPRPSAPALCVTCTPHAHCLLPACSGPGSPARGLPASLWVSRRSLSSVCTAAESRGPIPAKPGPGHRGQGAELEETHLPSSRAR